MAELEIIWSIWVIMLILLLPYTTFLVVELGFWFSSFSHQAFKNWTHSLQQATGQQMDLLTENKLNYKTKRQEGESNEVDENTDV